MPVIMRIHGDGHNMFSIDLYFIWRTDEMQGQIVVNDN